MGSRPRKTTTTRRREKRQGRREEREERREKTEDRPQEAARGPQMRPPEGANPFFSHAALWWDLWRLQGQKEESREKGEERRNKREKVFYGFS